MKCGPFKVIAMSLFIAFVESASGGSVAMPDFAIIGQRWGRIMPPANEASFKVFPKQVAIDYNSNGIIYGFVYEYRIGSELFADLKAEIQKTIQVEPKMVSSKMAVWRNENRKLTITLTLSQEENNIKVVAVSIDKEIRRD